MLCYQVRYDNELIVNISNGRERDATRCQDVAYNVKEKRLGGPYLV